MSTWWYFECVTHDPPLRSPDEFTQHTGDAAYRQGVDLAQNRPVSADYPDDSTLAIDYFDRFARRFLVAHPSCELELVDEYGHRRPLRGPGE